ncbi:protein of unknown function (plasmid) [Caballeronia sp. S22]
MGLGEPLGGIDLHLRVRFWMANVYERGGFNALFENCRGYYDRVGAAFAQMGRNQEVDVSDSCPSIRASCATHQSFVARALSQTCSALHQSPARERCLFR